MLLKLVLQYLRNQSGAFKAKTSNTWRSHQADVSRGTACLFMRRQMSIEAQYSENADLAVLSFTFQLAALTCENRISRLLTTFSHFHLQLTQYFTGLL